MARSLRRSLALIVSYASSEGSATQARRTAASSRWRPQCAELVGHAEDDTGAAVEDQRVHVAAADGLLAGGRGERGALSEPGSHARGQVVGHHDVYLAAVAVHESVGVLFAFDEVEPVRARVTRAAVRELRSAQ